MKISDKGLAQNVGKMGILCYTEGEPGRVGSTGTGSDHNRRWRATMADAEVRRFRRPSHWTLAQALDHYSIPEPNTGCRLWCGAGNSDGYGSLVWGVRARPAHRLAWQAWRGEIPPGMHVCHKCDVPACINPDHLFLGTHQQNMADRDAKGRQYDRSAERNGRAKLTSDEIAAIRGLAGKHTQKRIGEMYGIGQSQVSRILRGEQWA